MAYQKINKHVKASLKLGKLKNQRIFREKYDLVVTNNQIQFFMEWGKKLFDFKRKVFNTKLDNWYHNMKTTIRKCYACCSWWILPFFWKFGFPKKTTTVNTLAKFFNHDTATKIPNSYFCPVFAVFRCFSLFCDLLSIMSTHKLFVLNNRNC